MTDAVGLKMQMRMLLHELYSCDAFAHELTALLTPVSHHQKKGTNTSSLTSVKCLVGPLAPHLSTWSLQNQFRADQRGRELAPKVNSG
jgi:hypothetical protein